MFNSLRNVQNKIVNYILKLCCSLFFEFKLLMGCRPKDLMEFLSSEPIKNVLFIIAHPDDEIFCSGLILTSVALGLDVSILCMTRGEGGDRGEILKEEIASRRESELKNACAVLNIKNLWFMNYVDPEPQAFVLVAPDHDSAKLTQELVKKITTSGAQILVTHGSTGEYNHPAHICLHTHVRKAVREIDDDCIFLLTMNAWNPRHPMQNIINYYDFPSFQLDVSPFHEMRLSALKCHQTQNHVFEKFSKNSLENFIRFSEVERYCLIKDRFKP